MVKKIFALFFYLIAVSYPAAASAQMMQSFADEFQQIPRSPDSQQFAVAVINNHGTEYLWPFVGNPTVNTSTGTRNWVFAYGTQASHAEYQIAGTIVPVLDAYSDAFGEPVSSLNVYSVLSPCDGCSQSISSINTPTYTTKRFAFTNQYGSDSDTFDSIRRMQNAGWLIYRACPSGTANCITFQRKLQQCAMQKPVICKYCNNRINGITQWINDVSNSIKTRTASSWVNSANQLIYPSPEEKIEAVQAWTDCFNQAAQYPIEGFIGSSQNADAPDGGAPPNWNAIVGIIPIVPGGPGDPFSHQPWANCHTPICPLVGAKPALPPKK